MASKGSVLNLDSDLKDLSTFVDNDVCLIYFSFDKDENVRLEEEIKLHHLEQLMYRFHKHKPDDILIQPGTGFFPAKTQARTPGRMNLKEFKQTVSDVLATDEYDDYLEKLFMKVSVSFT